MQIICQVQRAKHPRTKAKVRVSHKGWRTFFRFAECNVHSILARKQKCVSAIKAGARSLDLLSANIWINIHTTKYFRKYFFFLDLSLLLMLQGLPQTSFLRLNQTLRQFDEFYEWQQAALTTAWGYTTCFYLMSFSE